VHPLLQPVLGCPLVQPDCLYRPGQVTPAMRFELPGVDDNEFGVVEGSLVRGPSRGGGRRLGLAHTDHDPLHTSVVIGRYDYDWAREVMKHGAQHT
jgi:hypothetical protein